jgi:hypothetical protein
MSVANGAFTRTNSFGENQERTYAEFFVDTVPDHAASEIAGREIHKEITRVRIFMPGNAHTRPVFEATPEFQGKYPKAWKDFLEDREPTVDGFPLEQWAALRKAQVLELKALGFKTVEHLRNMDDLAVQRIGMGGMGLRNLAKAFLDDEEAMALTKRLTAENERRNAENEEMRAKLTEQSGMIERLFHELQTLKNAPSALATHIPGMSDPMEQLRQAAPAAAPAASALDDLKPRARRGKEVAA